MFLRFGCRAGFVGSFHPHERIACVIVFERRRLDCVRHALFSMSDCGLGRFTSQVCCASRQGSCGTEESLRSRELRYAMGVVGVSSGGMLAVGACCKGVGVRRRPVATPCCLLAWRAPGAREGRHPSGRQDVYSRPARGGGSAGPPRSGYIRQPEQVTCFFPNFPCMWRCGSGARRLRKLVRPTRKRQPCDRQTFTPTRCSI